MTLSRFSDYADLLVELNDLTAHLGELCGDRLQMLRDHIFYGNITAGDRCGTHKCSGLDLIRDDRIVCSVKTSYTFDTDHIRTCAFNVCAHTV